MDKGKELKAEKPLFIQHGGRKHLAGGRKYYTGDPRRGEWKVLNKCPRDAQVRKRGPLNYHEPVRESKHSEERRKRLIK